MQIIGISGTSGSGKDTIGEMLAERHGWLFVSVSDLLREEAKKRRQTDEREVLRTISAEWRRQYGLGILVDKAIERYKESGGKYEGLAVGPMRNPGEAQHTKDLGGVLVWVDADPQVRYNRINSRGQGAKDQKTFQEFSAEEQAEMRHSGDEATLSISDVKAKADIFLKNDGDNIKGFQDQAEKALAKYIKL